MLPYRRPLAALVPLVVSILFLPVEAIARDAGVHQQCSSCHLGGTAPGEARGAGCITCHADLVADAPLARGPSGHGDCGTCHVAHPTGQPYLLRQEAAAPDRHGLDAASRLCRSCHPDHLETRGPLGRFVRHPVGLPLGPVRASAANAAGLRLEDVRGTPGTSDDVLSCVTCHDVHAGRGAHRLRWTAAGEADACRTCHAVDRPAPLVAATR